VAGVATGGLSEVARIVKPKTPDNSQAEADYAATAPNSTYGGGATQVNPDWTTYNQKKADIQNQFIPQMNAANAQGDAATRDGLRQQMNDAIDALGAPPPTTIATPLGASVQASQAQQAQAQKNLAQDRSAIGQTGIAANAQGQEVTGAMNTRAAQAQKTAAPTLQVQGNARDQADAAQQQAANFKADTSGIAGINAATAAGTTALNNFRANDAGAAGIRSAATTGAGGIADAGAQGGQSVSNFQAATGGVQALNNFATGPAGPSAAEAQLRMQADKDKRTALALARSARGGPAATALALRRAQAENSATAAETRGQAGVLRAQEAATARGQNLSALTSAGGLEQQASTTNLNALTAGAGLNLQGQIAAGNLNVQGQTNATNADLTGSGQNLAAAQSSGALGVQGATAASAQQLEGSGQQLQATQTAGALAQNTRGQDIQVAQSNLQAAMQTMQLNDQQSQFYTQLGEQARQAGINAQMQAQQTGASIDQANSAVALQYGQQAWQMLSTDQQAALQKMGLDRGIIQANQAATAQGNQMLMQFLGTGLVAAGAAFGGPGGAAAGAGASSALQQATSANTNSIMSTPMPSTQLTYPTYTASDRRVKTAITKARSLAADLRKTPGSEYAYKDPKKHGDGRHTGPMAGDLKKTKAFASAVKNIGGVDHVDGGRLALSHHAALHDLQKQVDRLARIVKPKGKSPEARA
jgi:hypothetical protein